MKTKTKHINKAKRVAKAVGTVCITKLDKNAKINMSMSNS